MQIIIDHNILITYAHMYEPPWEKYFEKRVNSKKFLRK